MSESDSFASLRARIACPGDRFDRVENGLGAGMPDVNYCIEGCEGWIEVKAPLEPARPTTALMSGNRHPVSIDQVNWMIMQQQAGGRAFLYIATRKRLMLIPARKVIKLDLAINKQTVEQLERISIWKVRLPATDAMVWDYLRQALKGKS